MKHCRVSNALLLCSILLASGAACETLGRAEAVPAGMPETVTGAVTYVNVLECYVESTTRSAGIWVRGDTTGIEIGDVVTASGTYSELDGECVILDAILSKTGESMQIKPLGMANKWIGGGALNFQRAVIDFGLLEDPETGERSWQWYTTGGANNTGLLIKTWGTVKSVYYSPINGARWFYVDDGFGAVSDYGDHGVLVYSDADVKQGQFVTVTGISSVEPPFDDSEKLVRVVRPRSADDVVVLKDVEKPEYPFSDEFDGPDLDPRWVADPNAGEILPSACPGWLTMRPTEWYSECPMVIQPVPGDWDAEFKLRLEYAGSAAFHDVTSCGLESVVSYPTVLAGAGRSTMGYNDVVCVAGQYLCSMVGDTCYFRVQRRGDVFTACAGFDGVTYSDPESIEIPGLWSAALVARARDPEDGFAAHFDYIRFTPATEPGAVK